MNETQSSAISPQPSEEQTKKLLVDTTFLFDQYSKRGIGKYGKEVLKRLIKLIEEAKNWEIHFVGFLNLEQNLMQIGLSQYSIEHFSKFVKFHSIGDPFLSSIGNLRRWSKIYLPAIESIKPDIFYSVNFERGLPSVPFFSSKLRAQSLNPKTVVMAHDAIPIVTNKYSAKGYFHNILKGFFYKFVFNGIVNANLVLTNSNFSRNDLINYGKVPESKIHTIYLGVDEAFSREHIVDQDEVEHTLEVFGVKDEKYFIYDSGLEANKGINELLQIFSKLQILNSEKIPNKLLITGGDFFKGKDGNIKARSSLGMNALRQMKKLGIFKNIITTDRVSDEDLEMILKNASAYINLSKYEGFSFGPIQAMMAEVPCIAGNYSCLPEITGDGAFLIDTTDLDISAAKIKDFISDDTEVEKQVRKGREVSKKYSWDTTVEKTWELIRQL